MKSASKEIYDTVAENNFCVSVQRRGADNASESMFLDLETYVEPIIKLRNVFNECCDDYVPDFSFTRRE